MGWRERVVAGCMTAAVLQAALPRLHAQSFVAPTPSVVFAVRLSANSSNQFLSVADSAHDERVADAVGVALLAGVAGLVIATPFVENTRPVGLGFALFGGVFSYLTHGRRGKGGG